MEIMPRKLLHCLKGNCSENFLLQNIFGFHVYITNIYVKLSTETVNMQKKTTILNWKSWEPATKKYRRKYLFVAGSRPH